MKKCFLFTGVVEKKALFNNGPWSLLFDLGKAGEATMVKARKREKEVEYSVGKGKKRGRASRGFFKGD